MPGRQGRHCATEGDDTMAKKKATKKEKK